MDPEITIIGDWKFGPEAKNRFKQTVTICKTSTHINVMEIHEKWGNKWGLAGESSHRHRLVGFHPAAQVFEMCGHAMGCEHLPMVSSDDVVYGFAAKHPDGCIQVHLLNKRSEAVSVELALSGVALKGAHFAVESFVAPGEIARRHLPHLTGSPGAAVRLEPLSFNHFIVTPLL